MMDICKLCRKPFDEDEGVQNTWCSTGCAAIDTIQKKLAKVEVTPEDIFEAAKRLVKFLEAPPEPGLMTWNAMRGRIAKDLRDKLTVILGDGNG